MTGNQKTIAETAIGIAPAQTFTQIELEVSQMTGISIAEIKKTLVHLSDDAVLRVRVTPARNCIEIPDAEHELTFAWYQKGERW
jgi:NOL1/NOP2/fmu family ribosome biogenesis protein